LGILGQLWQFGSTSDVPPTLAFLADFLGSLLWLTANGQVLIAGFAPQAIAQREARSAELQGKDQRRKSIAQSSTGDDRL
jgi:hypothetical protein